MPEPTNAEPDGPTRTQRFPADGSTQPPAPAGSGSAAAPLPRRRSRAESSEPAAAEGRPEAPEDQTPVDPWAGTDTTGWDLLSIELPSTPPAPSAPSAPFPSPAPPAPSAPSAPFPSPAPPAPSAPSAPFPSPAPPAPSAPSAPFPSPAPPAPSAPSAPFPSPAPPAPSAPFPSSAPRQPPSAGPAAAASPPAGYAAVPSAAPAPTDAPAPAHHSHPTPPPAGFASPLAPGRPTSKPTGSAPSRNRRKWPWALLFVIACCCGGPAYWATPVLNQFPAHAALPTEFGDLHLREDHHSRQTTAELARQIDEAHWTASDTFAGIYRTGAGKKVTVFGGTGLWLAPKSAAEAEIERLTGQYALGPAQVIGTGVRSRHGRCALGHEDGTDVVVCTSVDHSSIATAVFTRLSVADSATLLGALRKQIVVQPD
ncbi:hypothetical protein [Salinispora pacifica]|uniref:hypothetical protein n=1 Tax=Salinispora pacifica TaxID=351187 RepID=UPI0006ACAD6A|nr:hypothetical protein [Salinispora pacifica]